MILASRFCLLLFLERSFVVIFCEESGRIVGEFNVDDIVDLFIHFWKYLVDRSYVERIGHVLSDYVTPQFRGDLIKQAAQFSESASTEQLLPVDSPAPNVALIVGHDTAARTPDCLNVTSTTGEDSAELDSPIVNRSEGEKQGSVTTTTLEESSETVSQAPQHPGNITDCMNTISSGLSTARTSCVTLSVLSGQPRWCPNDLRKVVLEGTDSYHSTPYYNHFHSQSSNFSPRTSFSSQGGQTTQQPMPLYGASVNQIISDRLILAVFLSHHHREVFLPLPAWFSIRLFEDPSFTPNRFRTLRKIMSKKMLLPTRLYGSEGPPEGKSLPAVSPSTNQTFRPTTKLSQRGSIETCVKFEKKSSVSSDEKKSVNGNSSRCSRVEDAKIGGNVSLAHLVPPPWISSLDLWKRK